MYRIQEKEVMVQLVNPMGRKELFVFQQRHLGNWEKNFGYWRSESPDGPLQ